MNLQAILNDYYINLGQTLKFGSVNSYKSYLNSIMNNGGDIATWLEGAIKSANPIAYLTNEFDKHFSNSSINSKTLDNWKSALIKLGTFVCGNTHAGVNLQSIKAFNLIACQMVAQSAVFCSQAVFADVVNGKLGSSANIGGGNIWGSWHNCTTRRFRPGEKRRTIVNGIYLDDNTLANQAIKNAVAESLKRKYGLKVANKFFVGVEVCHIWPGSCYDPRYHTSVGNLVLLPRAIAGFSDHCSAVRELLQYEAYQRFKFLPNGESLPLRPQFYNQVTWRY